VTWQLDPKKVQTTFDKNVATSFGLTLVVGLPFARPILERVAQIQTQAEALLPDRFHWYELDHLHATVIAPLRGRYRAEPPLQRHELPTDLDGFAETLGHAFSALQPFSLELDRLFVTSDGRLIALGSDPDRVWPRVADCLASFPGLDPPKRLDGWHVTLGYLQPPVPFVTEAEPEGFENEWGKIQASSLGSMIVDRVWLVHYADRMLSHIVGRVQWLLGQPNFISADELLRKLHINSS